jgi:hypothetical protein
LRGDLIPDYSDLNHLNKLNLESVERLNFAAVYALSAVTFAFRSGMRLELVSKIIRRHANLSMIQRYLGKASHVEAMRRIENLYV